MLLLVTSFTCLSQTTTRHYIPEKIQDGVILHCFCWPLRDIIYELPNIAEAGFGAIQVSPMQAPNIAGQPWYYFYGPCDYRFFENVMGTRTDMIELCDKASEYGIKIIQDMLPNHLIGIGDDPWRAPDQWADQWWFEIDDGRVVADQGVVTWDSRWSETHQNIFGWEIRTDRADVQQRMREYLDDLYSMGVRGCRWDCAKHIALPSEGDDFWANVLGDSPMFHYGEILGVPNSHPELMREYIKYMSVTDDAFNGYYEHNSRHWQLVPRNKCVFWAESHDTFANGQYGSQQMSDIDIDRSWALVASRQGATALYLSRPGLLPMDDIKLGVKGSTHFTSAQVREVNRFHNVMGDLPETFWSGDGTTAVYRSKGAVVVQNHSGDISIPAGNLSDGIYDEQISGNKFVVSDNTLTGRIGDTGIAVIYNANEISGPLPAVTISPESLEFTGDTHQYTLDLSRASSATYTIDGASPVNFTSPVTITVGEGVEVGSTIRIDWTAQNSANTAEGYFEIIKRDPAKVNYVYARADGNEFDDLSVYCYIYSPAGTVNAIWPGCEMHFDPTIKLKGKQGWYYTPISIDLQESGMAMISTSGEYRYPAGGVPGIALEGKSLAFELTTEGWNVTPVSSNEIDEYVYTAYFDNSSTQWNNVYAYCWDKNNYGKTAFSGDWPGTLLTDQIEWQGRQLLIFTMQPENGIDPATCKIIFNNGNGTQSKDLDFIDRYIYTSDGPTSQQGPGFSSVATTPVECIGTDTYYNLQGVRLNDSPSVPGIYIVRRSNGTVTKIAIH